MVEDEAAAVVGGGRSSAKASFLVEEAGAGLVVEMVAGAAEPSALIAFFSAASALSLSISFFLSGRPLVSPALSFFSSLALPLSPPPPPVACDFFPPLVGADSSYSTSTLAFLTGGGLYLSCLLDRAGRFDPGGCEGFAPPPEGLGLDEEEEEREGGALRLGAIAGSERGGTGVLGVRGSLRGRKGKLASSNFSEAQP